MSNKHRIKENLCLLSGEDTTIIFQMNDKIITNYFTLIGTFVFVLFMLFLSSTILLFIDIFKDEFLFDILIGLVWAFAITNIYVLLLYTSTPTIHPHKYKRGNKIVLASALKKDDTNFKLFSGSLGSFLFKITFLIIITGSTAVPFYYNFIYTAENANPSLINCINESMHNYSFWLFNLFILFLLVLPVILKYLLRGIGALTKKETFYHRKQKLEKRLINKQYKLFKNHYETLLKKNDDYWRNRIKNKIEPYLKQLDKYNIDDANFLRNKIENDLTPQTFERYEAWEDSPFNTIKKEDALSFKTENDLILKLYEAK
jgi:hypothetical protein